VTPDAGVSTSSPVVATSDAGTAAPVPGLPVTTMTLAEVGLEATTLDRRFVHARCVKVCSLPRVCTPVR